MNLSSPSYIAPPLVTMAVTLCLLLAVLLWSRRDFTTRIFSGLLLSIAVLNLMVFAMRSSPDVQFALVWQRRMIVTVMGSLVFYYHFTLVYTNTWGQRRFLTAMYLILLVLMVLIPTDFFIREIQIRDYGYGPVLGPGIYFTTSIGALLLMRGTINLLRYYRLPLPREEKVRVVLLLIAAPLPLIGGGLGGFTKLPPTAIWCNLLFSVLCSIAILKYNLINLHVLARRGLAYTLVSIAVAIPYVGLLLMSNKLMANQIESWWIHAIFLFSLAILLRPLYGWAQNTVDRLFYRERYDYVKALEQFTRETQSISEPAQLSYTLLRLASGAVGCSTAGLLLPSRGNSDFVLIFYIGINNPPSGVILSNDSPIVKWLEQNGQPLSLRDLRIIPEFHTLPDNERHNLQAMQTALLVPARSSQGMLLGILLLGEKPNRQPYASGDLQILSTLGGPITITLENLKLYRDSIQVSSNFEAWLNSMSDSILIINTDLIIFFANTAAKNTLGAELGQICFKLIGRETQCPDCPFLHYLSGDDRLWRRTMDIRARTFDAALTILEESDSNLSLIQVLRDVTEQKKAEKELAQSREKLRNLYVRTRSAREEERTNIAREIHDELGQILSTVYINLGWLNKQLPENSVIIADKIAETQALTNRAIQTVRDVATRLRPAILDHLGIVAAIEWQCQEFSKNTDIKYNLDISPRDIDISPRLSTEIFRIFQETLTNISRHAGATRVTVSFKREDGNLILRVQDNGRGISEEQIDSPFSVGLIGMRERAYSIGGTLNVIPAPDGGTIVNLSVSLPATTS